MDESREPRIRLAGAFLVPAVAGAGILGAAIAAFVTHRLVGPGTPDPVTSSLLGSTAALLVSVPLLVAIQPWKVRAAGTWATIWLATMVGRLLLTPVVGLLVYSATHVRTDVFLLSLAGAYLASLAAEVAISARSVARSLGAAEAEVRNRSAPQSAKSAQPAQPAIEPPRTTDSKS